MKQSTKILIALLLFTSAFWVFSMRSREPQVPTATALPVVTTVAPAEQSMTPPLAQQPATPTSPQLAAIPDDVAYSVIQTNIEPGINRTLIVQINRIVSEDVLEAISWQFKAQDSRTYQRTFIRYHLPNVEDGAWALVAFDPNLSITILGLTVEKEQTLLSGAASDGRAVIGKWLDDGIGELITIFEESGKVFMERQYGPGDSIVLELRERISPVARTFEKAAGSSAGDHYIIDLEGNLQLRDDMGLMAVARKVD